jgi:hypothetical protein
MLRRLPVVVVVVVDGGGGGGGDNLWPNRELAADAMVPVEVVSCAVSLV